METTIKKLEPCPKEQYILEYFGLKEFDEDQKVTVDLGILTDLLYGFEEKQNKKKSL